jgi:osmoprotectant transport system permease protein
VTEYLSQNASRVVDLLVQHIWLAALPTVFGLVLALALGLVAIRVPRLRRALLSASGALYAVPSLALFVILPGILGTRILDPVNVIAALTIYSLALLARSVVDGLLSVPVDVRQAATAMGYRAVRRLLTVDLPIAVPVIVAGLRVVAVSNVSLVSVGALIGVGGLGELFTDGFQRDYLPPIVVGVVLSVALALLADLLLVTGQRVLTPWNRERKAVRA